MIWSVAVGSALGGVLRYLVAIGAQRATGGPFPVGTMAINVAGSFLLAFLLRFGLSAPGWNPVLRIGLTVGFCGGFTTFSTFSVETMSLMESGDYGRAAWNVAASVGLSLLAVAAGVALARVVTAPTVGD